MTNSIPFLSEILSAFPRFEFDGKIDITSDETLSSWFDVTDLATASVSAAGLMLAPESIVVNRRYASLWFGMSLRPDGWELPPIWDPIAGDYRTKDGWIRLHTNASHHRKAALSVLGDYSDREALAPVVEQWAAEELETAIVEAGGCAAEMRSLGDWQNHRQGRAVSQEPLVHWAEHGSEDVVQREYDSERPLHGVKVLDLTRVLAGPVAGRFLAAYGADVLRIDPPDWNEDAVVPEVTLGKRCAGLDLKTVEDRVVFEGLLKQADVLLHGYRPEALSKLGYDAERLREINPALVDVTLCAYGWTGPWSKRRGFDSLLQMSTGIADYGMSMEGADKPRPLPVQALDHATGYMMAAAVLYALKERRETGKILSAKLSLARTAHLLVQSKRCVKSSGLSKVTDRDIDPTVEKTAWGAAYRIKFPVEIAGVVPHWDYPAGELRSARPFWLI